VIVKPLEDLPKLMTIDPGKDKVAWAAFVGSKLTRCGVAGSWEGVEQFETLRGDVEVVIEVPQVYDRRRWRGDPNDLIDVAQTVGAIRWAARRARAVVLVRPHDWKGSAPKGIVNARVEKLIRESDDEADALATCPVAKSKRHDLLDAIGIGLWRLGRLKR
jgi:hypothetical protein